MMIETNQILLDCSLLALFLWLWASNGSPEAAPW